jgi:glycosyltransferase involved in cell wall biosynthesis
MKIVIAIGVRRDREAGAAGVVLNHAEQLQKLGHQVETWFFDDVLPSPRWPARFQELEFTFAVSRRIRRNPAQYEVVNLHAPSGCAYGLLRRLFPSAALPPYVFTLQGSEERYAVAMRFEEKKGRASHFNWKNRVWQRLYRQTMYDVALSTADFGNVANREGWVLSELKYSHPPGRIWYIPNGTNPEFLQPRTFVESEALRLLFVGTWLDRKGVFYLVESFEQVATCRPQLSLTVAGCGLPEVEVMAHFPAEIRSRVKVLPSVHREAMPDLYAGHDIFVFPSLVEGMPLTLLEAMASAMPVVTTNACGMADIVENGVNGILVPPADSAQIATAVESLCKSTELRKSLGSAAQETARRLTWAAVTQQLEHVLRAAMLAKERSTPP